MKKQQITKISILQTSKVVALCYGIFGLLVVPFGLYLLTSAKTKTEGMYYVFAPLIYGGLGFIGCLIVSALYNFLAKFVGGIEFTTTDK
jgi:hypothetical protein